MHRDGIVPRASLLRYDQVALSSSKSQIYDQAVVPVRGRTNGPGRGSPFRH
jgi:hypothetical protein